MQKLITRSWRKLFSFTAERVVKRYIQKDRSFSYKSLRLKIYKDVFHPGLFRSTKVFAAWLEGKQLNNLNLLELGCGSGMLSVIAACKGADVYAIDINPKAVDNVKLNAELNKVNITAFRSDLFSEVAQTKFSLVLINPPFFPKAPQSDYDHAWFCGENFEYFEKLFSQLKQRPAGEEYYMILSDSCDLQRIKDIAAKHGYQFSEVHQEKISGELLIIYTIDQPFAN
jgi:release factor glutamine methyltransferase